MNHGENISFADEAIMKVKHSRLIILFVLYLMLQYENQFFFVSFFDGKGLILNVAKNLVVALILQSRL